MCDTSVGIEFPCTIFLNRQTEGSSKVKAMQTRINLMSQLAVSDFFILCHSGSDALTCSVPWVTEAWRTHQSNPRKNHMLTCTSSYFWFYVPTTQETITSETTDKMSPADVDHVALLQPFKPRPHSLWGGASEPWSDEVEPCPES